MEFASPPREILHFNQYLVQKSGSFLQILLWFLDDYGSSTPVFRGLIWMNDFQVQVARLKQYIEKVGPETEEERHLSRPPLWNSPPVSFNFFDCVSRDDCTEIIIRNFSHKSVMDASASGTRVPGTTHGVYVSAGAVHRQIVMDLIKECSDKR